MVFFGDYVSEDAYVKKVKEICDKSIVIFTLPFKDKLENRFSFERASVLLAENNNVPIYTTCGQWFGYAPIVGGKVNTGFYQGQAAAELAIRILDGENPNNIPIQNSSGKYIFDYIQVKRFGISLASLPQGSIVINEPLSFYVLYKKQIWITTTVIITLTTMVIILAVNVIRRKRAEKKLLEYQAQLKSLASELSLTEEREKRRIATELHDRISQTLVISKLRLKSLREKNFSDNVIIALDETCESLDRIIQNTRSLIFDLSSPILYELGFEAAVAEWLDEQIKKKYEIETEFEDDGKHKSLDDDIRVLLFRSVQELLANVIRHAHAHRVKISSRKIGGQIYVSVEDDGIGFRPPALTTATAKRREFGLFSIQERLERLSGRFEIVSKPGQGTKATIIAPLKSAGENRPGKIETL
jgi:signal transduction histidine kinase